MHYLSTALLAALFVFPHIAKAEESTPRVFQYSLISSLLAGVYDGAARFDWLKTKGDFGIGTFNGINGEMVALDGTFYQITSDGFAHIVPGSQLAPLATLAFFKPDTKREMTSALTYAEFSSAVEHLLPSKNLPYAIRVDGTFTGIKTRSIDKQKPPYKPLAAIAKTQSVFDLKDVKGTMVGFWFPAYTSGIGVPGFHFHFITEDKKRGGHVLDFAMSSGTLQQETLQGMELVLPSDKSFLQTDLSTVGKADLNSVEK